MTKQPTKEPSVVDKIGDAFKDSLREFMNKKRFGTVLFSTTFQNGKPHTFKVNEERTHRVDEL